MTTMGAQNSTGRKQRGVEVEMLDGMINHVNTACDDQRRIIQQLIIVVTGTNFENAYKYYIGRAYAIRDPTQKRMLQLVAELMQFIKLAECLDLLFDDYMVNSGILRKKLADATALTPKRFLAEAFMNKDVMTQLEPVTNVQTLATQNTATNLRRDTMRRLHAKKTFVSPLKFAAAASSSTRANTTNTTESRKDIERVIASEYARYRSVSTIDELADVFMDLASIIKMYYDGQHFAYVKDAALLEKMIRMLSAPVSSSSASAASTSASAASTSASAARTSAPAASTSAPAASTANKKSRAEIAHRLAETTTTPMRSRPTTAQKATMEPNAEKKAVAAARIRDLSSVRSSPNQTLAATRAATRATRAASRAANKRSTLAAARRGGIFSALGDHQHTTTAGLEGGGDVFVVTDPAIINTPTRFLATYYSLASEFGIIANRQLDVEYRVRSAIRATAQIALVLFNIACMFQVGELAGIFGKVVCASVNLAFAFFYLFANVKLRRDIKDIKSFKAYRGALSAMIMSGENDDINKGILVFYAAVIFTYTVRGDASAGRAEFPSSFRGIDGEPVNFRAFFINLLNGDIDPTVNGNAILLKLKVCEGGKLDSIKLKTGYMLVKSFISDHADDIIEPKTYIEIIKNTRGVLETLMATNYEPESYLQDFRGSESEYMVSLRGGGSRFAERR